MLERCYYRALLQERRQTISKELQTSVASDNNSKVVGKRSYDPLYLLFSFFLSRNQHGFHSGRSVQSNMPKILKSIHEELNKRSSDTLVVFHTGKVFDGVPHYELLKKVSAIST